MFFTTSFFDNCKKLETGTDRYLQVKPDVG